MAIRNEIQISFNGSKLINGVAAWEHWAGWCWLIAGAEHVERGAIGIATGNKQRSPRAIVNSEPTSASKQQQPKFEQHKKGNISRPSASYSLIHLICISQPPIPKRNLDDYLPFLQMQCMKKTARHLSHLFMYHPRHRQMPVKDFHPLGLFHSFDLFIGN